ncbi:MAG: hypothetical protein AMXMBFR13_06740 [Phycisphaerae bacterium]
MAAATRNPGDLASGSGFGRFQRGERIRHISDVRPGDLLIEDSAQFDATNVCQVIEVRDGDKFTGQFVNPYDPDSPRLWSDQPFCIWDFELKVETKKFFIAV